MKFVIVIYGIEGDMCLFVVFGCVLLDVGYDVWLLVDVVMFGLVVVFGVLLVLLFGDICCVIVLEGVLVDVVCGRGGFNDMLKVFVVIVNVNMVVWM